MFRPQFAYDQEPGEEDFLFAFDTSNVPFFAGNLAVGATLDNVPLRLDSDYPFVARGVKVFNTRAGLAVRLRDAFGNYLSDDLNPTLQELTYAPAGPGVALGTLPVAFDADLLCPRGAVLWADLINTAAAPASIATLQIVVMGVKRYEQ
jgi:hypothetical protein